MCVEGWRDANPGAHLWNVYSECKRWQIAPREWCLRQMSGEVGKRGTKPQIRLAQREIDGERDLFSFHLLPSDRSQRGMTVPCFPDHHWFEMWWEFLCYTCSPVRRVRAWPNATRMVRVDISMAKQYKDRQIMLLHKPKNRRHKWTQMICRSLYKRLGLGVRASHLMQIE